jgi:membrane-bound lytic murein transglycosylase MltF
MIEDKILRTAWTGDADGMVERRFIRALVVFNRTDYFYSNGRPAGIVFEGLREFENFFNQRLNTGRYRVHVVPVPTTRDKIFGDLASGFGDVAAARLTITEARQKLVDFSLPTRDGIRSVAVANASAPALASLDDLSGKEVWLRRSTSHFEYVEKLNADLKKRGKAPVIIRAADENLETEDLLEMVNAGLMSYTAGDEPDAKFWAQVFPGIRVQENLPLSQDGHYAWAFRKNSPRLAAVVNEFVKGHREGTAFGNTLIRRYTGSLKYVKNSTSEAEMKKFNELAGIFRKYAAQYEFDTLLLAAQGYQESGLDQRARSHAGAVGVMQVKPSTAESSPVFIKGIDTAENNIHAGAKLLHFLVRDYFGDPAIDPLNRSLFAFAAYNAGPARVRRLRETAKKKGLNPNIWLRNVEVIAAKEIGQETVQYVANIYKYYLAYKVASERKADRDKAREAMKKSH